MRNRSKVSSTTTVAAVGTLFAVPRLHQSRLSRGFGVSTLVVARLLDVAWPAPSAEEGSYGKAGHASRRIVVGQR
jgi:hypothetical protein